MSEFKVYEMEDQAYNNIWNIKEKLINDEFRSEEKRKEAKQELNEMLKYSPVKKTFNSWEDLQDYLDKNKDENLIWEEEGNLDTVEYCSKCGATVKTNSQARVRHKKEMHSIQVCPEDRY